MATDPMWTPTREIATPEHLDRLLSTFDSIREDGGDNVAKARTWLNAQQRAVAAWLRKQQLNATAPPLRRLDVSHSCVSHLLCGGDGFAELLLHCEQSLDERAVVRLLPQLCDVLVLGVGSLAPSDRVLLRRFLLARCVGREPVSLS